MSTSSTRKTVTLKNTSGTTVNINSISATGDFSISTPNGCGTTLAPGASCTVSVSFTPPVPGAISGSLAITDSAPDSPQIVALTGSGTLPLSISPATLSFGTITVGTTSAAKTATLTNNESSTVAFSFAASSNYAINTSGTTCGASLFSKASCKIAVTFTPTANGLISGAVTISDGTSFTPQLVPLSGTGAGGYTAPLVHAQYCYLPQPDGGHGPHGEDGDGKKHECEFFNPQRNYMELRFFRRRQRHDTLRRQPRPSGRSQL